MQTCVYYNMKLCMKKPELLHQNPWHSIFSLLCTGHVSMCDRRPKPFWFRPLREKGALHLHQLAAVHFQWHRSLTILAPLLSLLRHSVALARISTSSPSTSLTLIRVDCFIPDPLITVLDGELQVYFNCFLAKGIAFEFDLTIGL